MVNRHPCCGARKGMWHYEDCFERQLFPDDVVSVYHGDIGDTMVIEKRGSTYQKLKADLGD